MKKYVGGHLLRLLAPWKIRSITINCIVHLSPYSRVSSYLSPCTKPIASLSNVLKNCVLFRGINGVPLIIYFVKSPCSLKIKACSFSTNLDMLYPVKTKALN